MEKSLKYWKWRAKEDEMDYPWENVLGGINPPKKMLSRGYYSVPQLGRNDWF